MRKLILFLLTVTCTALCAIGLAACVPKGLEAHTWSEDWKHNIDEHWHYCTARSDCDAKMDKAPHDLVVDKIYDGREPTCGETGRGVWKCLDCGVTIEDVIPATNEHEWIIQSQTPATCQSEGVIEKYCQLCFTAETETLPKIDHTYTAGQYTMTAAGHQQRCTACGQLSPLTAHEASSERVNYVAPNYTYLTDGRWDIVCKDCGYKMDEGREVNSQVPNKLNVTVYLSGTPVTPIPEGDDTYRVTLNASGDGTSPMYTLMITATMPNGTAFSNLQDVTLSDTMPGLRAYMRDNTTLREDRLGGSNDQYMIFGYGNGSWNLRVRNAGEYTIVFKFETGTPGTANYSCRAKYIMYITCVNSRAVSANTFGEPVAIVEDMAECLSAGYYEIKR